MIGAVFLMGFGQGGLLLRGRIAQGGCDAFSLSEPRWRKYLKQPRLHSSGHKCDKWVCW